MLDQLYPTFDVTISICETAKYLNTLLTPLSNILSAHDLIQKTKSERISKGFKQISFDVKGLFTSVPLHQK